MPPGQSHKIPSVTAFNYESPYRAHEFAIARASSEAARATERKELRAKFSRSQPLKLHLVGSARIGYLEVLDPSYLRDLCRLSSIEPFDKNRVPTLISRDRTKIFLSPSTPLEGSRLFLRLVPRAHMNFK